jgi:hypothetical protein
MRIVGAAGNVTATVNARLAVTCAESVTRIVKFDEAIVVGVPEINPVAALSCNPAGRVPLATDH